MLWVSSIRASQQPTAACRLLQVALAWRSEKAAEDTVLIYLRVGARSPNPTMRLAWAKAY